MNDLPLVQQFEANRQHARVVAYRMLGSLTEAEDAVQECWLRLSRSDADVIHDLKGWLTVVVSRICLDMLRSRKASLEASLDDDSHPVTPIQEANQEREVLLADSVGMALLVILDRLSPRERVAYVLHDLFSVPFSTIAELLRSTPVSVRQLASRARRQMKGAEQSHSSNTTKQRRIISRFVSALRSGDIEELVAVLSPDLRINMDRGVLTFRSI